MGKKILMSFLVKILIILFNLSFLNNFAFSHDYYLGKLTIDHPYIIETMPGAKVAGGYLKITNRGSSSDYLLGAESLFSKKIELHAMTIENDIMKMNMLKDGIEIPAGEEILLKPGGLHIMFKELNKPLKKGEKEKVVLKFKKNGKIIVKFAIESLHNSKHNH